MVTDTSRGGWRRALFGEHEAGLGPVLFAFLGPPLAWTFHFLTIYFLVALYCTTGRTDVTLEVGIATVVFAAASVWSGVVGYRKWRGLGGEEGWIESITRATSASSFLLLMGVLGAVFFTLLILVEGLPPLFVPTCSEVV